MLFIKMLTQNKLPKALVREHSKLEHCHDTPSSLAWIPGQDT